MERAECGKEAMRGLYQRTRMMTVKTCCVIPVGVGCDVNLDGSQTQEINNVRVLGLCNNSKLKFGVETKKGNIDRMPLSW